MSSTVTSKIYEFEDFRLIPDEGLLLHKGAPVGLNPKAFAVLAMLVEHHGHLVSKSEILDVIWEGAFVEEGAISKAVWFVRNALGDNSKERFIKTVPRRGYRFVAQVSVIHGSGAFRLAELSTDDPKPLGLAFGDGSSHTHHKLEEALVISTEAQGREASAPPDVLKVGAGHVYQSGFGGPDFIAAHLPLPQEGTVRPWVNRSIAIAVLLVTGAAALAFSLFFRTTDSTAVGDIKSIAVLPLKPIDRGNRNDLYENGIADELIRRLGGAKGIVVRQLSATLKYSEIDQDPVEVGREQKVDYVVASTYQLAGGKIIVTSRLINVANGQAEESYNSEKTEADLFSIQSAVANDIGNRLLARFGSDASGSQAKRGTDNQEAYRLYMMAVNLSEERGIQNVQKALEYLEQAVKTDPNYALAWAGIAHQHRDMVGGGDPDAKGHYEKSMQAIEKALSIDPNTSDAYSALCQNKNQFEYDGAGAEAACKRALELDPNSPQANKTYARFLYSRGRFDEALARIRTAMDLQPVSFRNQQIYGLTLFYARQFEAAERQFKRLLVLHPDHNSINGRLVTVLEIQGNESEAFEYLIKSLIGKKKSKESVARFKSAYKRSGWRGVTLERIKEEPEMAAFELAGLYSRLGDADKAFGYLEKAYRERSFLIAVLQVAPQLDALRGDPRYADLVRRIEGN